jgi:hypothetical protein
MKILDLRQAGVGLATITIQIGNSDDKLGQEEWSDFVKQTGAAISSHAEKIHFFGTSDAAKPWQNCAWVAEIEPDKGMLLRETLVNLRTFFRQDSVAWTEGQTRFL